MMIKPYVWFLLSLWIIAGVITAGAGGKKKQEISDPTDIRQYIEQAKQMPEVSGAETGSLWTPNGPNSNLFSDIKARNVNDVVTILVSESTQAVASAASSNSRSTSTTQGFDKLFGAEKLIKEIPTMVSGKSDASFDGKGTTTRATTLSTTLTARVTDVLPNGYLVIEGKREIRVNNENQSVMLKGIVRPSDINKRNMVSSAAIAQMSVFVQGRGVASQTIKPGWLYKILTGVLPF